MLRHAQYQVEHYGEHGMIQLRKHLPWYFKGVPGFRHLRAAAVKVESLDDVERLCVDARKEAA